MTTSAPQMELDPNQHSILSKLLMQQFRNKVVGQEPAVQALIDMFEYHQSGVCDPFKPVGVALFLGNTGPGKRTCVKCLRIHCLVLNAPAYELTAGRCSTAMKSLSLLVVPRLFGFQRDPSCIGARSSR